MNFFDRLAGLFKADSTVATPLTLDSPRPQATMDNSAAARGMQFGIPQNYGSYGLVDAARPGPERPYEPLLDFDFNRLLSPFDLSQLRSASRKLMYNLGPARSAITQKANYSFGKAWKPKFIGDDTDWGKEAKELLQDEFYPLCDIRGPQFDFVTGLHLDSITMDKDGDILIILTEDANGYPQFVRVLAHRISSGDSYEGKLKSGMFQDNYIWNGVIRNEDGRPLGYRVQVGGDEGWTTSKYVDIPAQDCIFVADPDSADQIRGLPALTPAIEDLLDLRHTQKFEKQAQMMAAAIGLVETNEVGGPTDLKSLMMQAQNQPGAFPAPPGVSFSNFAGGLIKYFRAGTGGKIEVLSNSRPSQGNSDFMDRLIRNSCAALDWPYELAWNPSGLSGTNSRLVISQAMRAVDDRQGLMKPVALRMLQYAISKYIKLGRLKESPDWAKWDFTYPPKLSVDQGRDRGANLNDWRAGLLNYTDILAEKGEEISQKLYERALECAMKQTIMKEINAEYGVTITADEMGLILPNGTPPPQAGGGDNEPSDDGANPHEANANAG